MKLTLSRPLVFLDLETTGPNPVLDRIVQMAFVKVKPDGTRTSWSTLVHPGVLIPQEATDVHGITNEDVKDAPTFAALASKVVRALDGCDVAGFGVRRFDWPLLQVEMKRAGVEFSLKPHLLDALQIFHTFNRRDLSAAVERYAGRKHLTAHDAMADVEATMDVLEGQLDVHEELPRSVDELVAWLNPRDPSAIDEAGKFRWVGDEPTVNFGKNLGLSMRSVDKGFYRWLLSGDFPEDTKALARAALEGRYPVRQDKEAARAV